MDKKRILLDWLVIPVLGSFVIAFFTELREIQAGNWIKYFESVVFSTLYWAFLANGNSFIICQIDKRYTWLDAPVKRAIIGVVAMAVVTFIISTIIIYAIVDLYFGYSFLAVWEHDGIMIYVIPFSITLVVSLWLHGQQFLKEWRQAAIDVEQLKTENVKSKFEALRSQVNPHFLFNSLNALTSLVHSDQDKAVAFIQKLSSVYRYVLDNQTNEVVELHKELDFLKSFAYLNTIRFGENFKINYTGLDDNLSGHIPPVVMQMLVENCIKHNEISKDHKIEISVKREGQFISVENNINPMDAPRSDSNGLGLSNIKSRYAILTNQEVEVRETKESFYVKLPILEMT